MKHKPWANEHLEFLRSNYANADFKYMLCYLQRTKDAVSRKASDLGLKREHKKKAAYKGRKAEPMKPMTLAVKNAKHRMKADPCAGKHPVRIDHKTVVYVPDACTPQQSDAIVSIYRKHSKKTA